MPWTPWTSMNEVEDVDASFADWFGEISTKTYVTSLQQMLVQLALVKGDSALRVTSDGVMGPKTAAATNRALSKYVTTGSSSLRTGGLSQSEILNNVSEIIGLLSLEVMKSPAPPKKPSVVVKKVAPPPPTYKELVEPPFYKKPLVLAGAGVLVVGALAMLLTRPSHPLQPRF